jgi:hypothetical protein
LLAVILLSSAQFLPLVFKLAAPDYDAWDVRMEGVDLSDGLRVESAFDGQNQKT